MHTLHADSVKSALASCHPFFLSTSKPHGIYVFSTSGAPKTIKITHVCVTESKGLGESRLSRNTYFTQKSSNRIWPWEDTPTSCTNTWGFRRKHSINHCASWAFLSQPSTWTSSPDAKDAGQIWCPTPIHQSCEIKWGHVGGPQKTTAAIIAL